MQRILFLSLLFIQQICFSQTSITEYYDFLKEQDKSPKDYIFEIFETNDIIILGERDHRDTIQYNLIQDILSDKRFVENIGYVYSEVGIVNKTEKANQILKKNHIDQSEFEKELIKLIREIDFNPLWEKYNIYKYLKGIYSINKTLSEQEKITIGLTDVAFNWSTATIENYKIFDEHIERNLNRDSIMAYNFVSLYESQIPKNGKKKALLIQNRPHAEKLIYGKKYKTVGKHIADKYPKKVKVIALNWFDYRNENEFKLTDNGKWDVAFYKSKNKTVGFDLKDTPFGKFYYNEPLKIKYEDIIDGIIFYEPFYNWKCVIGIPNIVDEEFSYEILRRYNIYDGEERKYTEEERYEEIKYYNKVREVECFNTKLNKDKMLELLKTQ